VLAIYANATTAFRRCPEPQEAHVDAIDDLDWYSASARVSATCTKGLLEKNAKREEERRWAVLHAAAAHRLHGAPGAAQAGELVQDPAAGTGGFLIAADRYIKARRTTSRTSPSSRSSSRHRAFYGVELVQDTHRLALMNLMLHDIEAPIEMGDTMTPMGESVSRAPTSSSRTLPFGTKTGGGQPDARRLHLPHVQQAAQLPAAHLSEPEARWARGGGAARQRAVRGEHGTDIRRDLMEKCDLHTILRLPTGIFYAAGVKTNVLFFTKGTRPRTRATRRRPGSTTCAPTCRRSGSVRRSRASTSPSSRRPLGRPAREEPSARTPGEEGRFRKFTREDIKARGDNLDISWLKDESAQDPDELPEPGDIADDIMQYLHVAMTEMEALRKELEATE
jgi:type I restriction enzyme M protein